MKKSLLAFTLAAVLLLTGCGRNALGNNGILGSKPNQGKPDVTENGTQGDVADLGDDNKTFGDSFEDLGIYDGYVENAPTDLDITCIYGTDKGERRRHFSA